MPAGIVGRSLTLQISLNLAAEHQTAPMDASLNRFEAEPRDLRDLLVRALLQVAEGHDLTVLRRQLRDRAKDVAVRLLLDQHLLRGLFPVRYLQALVGVFGAGG